MAKAAENELGEPLSEAEIVEIGSVTSLGLPNILQFHVVPISLQSGKPSNEATPLNFESVPLPTRSLTLRVSVF